MSRRLRFPTVTLAFIVSQLSASLAFQAPAHARQILIQSDRYVEYPYRWQGHSPRGSSECFAGASQSLMGSLNSMANISSFDSRNGTNIRQQIKNKYEQAGPVLANTTTFTTDESKSNSFRANQRGLVVAIKTHGWKPGSSFSNTRKRWKGLGYVRESKCGGIVQYSFIVYAPEGYQLQPIKSGGSSGGGSSSDSSGGGQSNLGHPYYVTNECRHPIRMALRYKDPKDGWVSRYWYNFDPGESANLLSGGKTIYSENSVYYYYAYAPGTSDEWTADDNRYTIGGRSYGFRKRQGHSNGKYRVTLTCTNS
jgi:hypothetical protein